MNEHHKDESRPAFLTKLSDSKTTIPWLPLIFFAAFYIWLYFVVEPHLIFHGLGTIVVNYPDFKLTLPFAAQTINSPGGLAEYLTGFLSQWFYYSWLGGLIITALAFLVYLLLRILVVSIAGCPCLLCYIPPICILAIYSTYQHPLLIALVVLFALFAGVTYLRLPLTSRRSLALFALLFALVYWAVAAGAAVFLALALAVEIAMRRRPLTAALIVVTAFVMAAAIGGLLYCRAFSWVFLSYLPVREDMIAGLKPFGIVCAATIYILPAATVALAPLWFRIQRRSTSHSKNKPKTGSSEGVTFLSRVRWPRKYARLLETAAVFLLAAAALSVSFDPKNKKWVLINSLSARGQWEKLLTNARLLPPRFYNPYINHDINRALYHTGRLPFDMFAYPQSPEGLMLLTKDQQSALWRCKMLDLCIRLGSVDTAARLGGEILAIQGDLPLVLQRLALIAALKDKPRTATVYLKTLAENPIYTCRARRLLAALKQSAKWIGPENIDALRTRMLKNDITGPFADSPEYILLELLRHNPRNKMAFEYLMAHYLLTEQLGKFVANIHRLDDFDYKNIPHHYEEALLIYTGTTGRNVDLPGRKISAETIHRYNEFVNTYRRFEDQQGALAVFDALVDNFGNTYWFYSAFELPGFAAR